MNESVQGDRDDKEKVNTARKREIELVKQLTKQLGQGVLSDIQTPYEKSVQSILGSLRKLMIDKSSHKKLGHLPHIKLTFNDLLIYPLSK